MSNENGEDKSERTPEELESMLRSEKQSHTREAWQQMSKQEKQAYYEVQLQVQDLICQVLGFEPTAEQRKKFMKGEKKSTGREIIYWQDTAILMLSPIKAKPVMMRVGDKKQKVKFVRDYDILKDDPTGYKFRNPDDNYVANNYPDRDPDDDNLISP